MFDSAKRKAGVLALAGALGALALGAGAPAAGAQELAARQWPADAVGKTYRFDAPEPGVEQTLQYQNLRDTVRAAIGATGLVETHDVAAARFVVSFKYGSERSTVTVARPRDPFFDPYYPRGYYGPHGFFGHGHHGWGVGAGYGFYGPAWEPVRTQVERATLTVEIRDNDRNGAAVYRAGAVATGRQADPARIAPALVQAIFDGFPANNGRTQEIDYR
ncbi:DUF4136 domain-containing protein [Orrella sp. JC864]|uniref:DUF4136 domain-containing protein n=1 Tax=Orrella sp. JC864 TaxID=3120298 RepID=UPI0012BBBAC8